jgi:hypothetical protein
MEDIIYIGIAISFFILTWGLMKICEVLGENKTGEKSLAGSISFRELSQLASSHICLSHY